MPVYKRMSDKWHSEAIMRKVIWQQASSYTAIQWKNTNISSQPAGSSPELNLQQQQLCCQDIRSFY